MNNQFHHRRNKSPHNHEEAGKKEVPFFSREAHTPFFNTMAHVGIQPKLRVGQADDRYEIEADKAADTLVNDSTFKPGVQNKATASIQKESPDTPKENEKQVTAEQRIEGDKLVQEKLQPQDKEPEREEERIQKKKISSPGSTASGFSQQLKSASGRGSKIDYSTRAAMETSFGRTFDSIIIHTDAESVRMNEHLGARAFTHGTDVYFNSGQYNTDSREGRHLLAHELTHVVQQANGNLPQTVQRDGFGELRVAEACAQLLSDIHSEPAYKALAPDDKKLADEIMGIVNMKKQHERYQLLIKLKLLFQTPLKSEADITAETNISTAEAVKVEKARVVKPKAVKNLDLEEKASQDPKRKWKAIKGKFGGGTYYVDSSSATNIVVKAKIFLKPTGTGTPDNVKDIKSMEDGIEKKASTKGYVVDIKFVDDASDPDTFTINVNPGKWQVATNWGGGDPGVYAHELHHLFAFELDRYNYIESHAGNESMEIPTRLYWFRQELNKPAGYNDPTSIMDSASHPNDSDVCAVAGLDQASCMAERSKIKKP